MIKTWWIKCDTKRIIQCCSCCLSVITTETSNSSSCNGCDYACWCRYLADTVVKRVSDVYYGTGQIYSNSSRIVQCRCCRLTVITTKTTTCTATSYRGNNTSWYCNLSDTLINTIRYINVTYLQITVRVSKQVYGNKREYLMNLRQQLVVDIIQQLLILLHRHWNYYRLYQQV